MKMKEKINKQETEGEIKVELREKYCQRLSKGYSKNGQFRLFVDQYRQARGQELKKKFWSKHSSSRYAFDLYSWMANDDACKDFQVEYPLKGVVSGNSPAISYMDVYVRTEHDIYFIESKYQEKEKSNNELVKELSGAYYQTLSEKQGMEAYPSADFEQLLEGNGDYYYNSEHKFCQTPLDKRFSGNQVIQENYLPFAKEMVRESQHLDPKEKDWFDAKQELCHLLGIARYLVDGEHQEELNGIERVHLLNIVYKASERSEKATTYAQNFIEQAKEMMNKILQESQSPITFSYGTSTAQEVIEKYGSKIAYENDGKTVEETLKANF